MRNKDATIAVLSFVRGCIENIEVVIDAEGERGAYFNTSASAASSKEAEKF